ncbi:hypothetical protein HMPREF1066_01687 [Bacteroides fragilis CL03T00C08]|nr:hypothetical protein HMPREF1066_01687 [Bacteroides fragilis CL03T00C08]
MVKIGETINKIFAYPLREIPLVCKREILTYILTNRNTIYLVIRFRNITCRLFQVRQIIG